MVYISFSKQFFIKETIMMFSLSKKRDRFKMLSI